MEYRKQLLLAAFLKLKMRTKKKIQEATASLAAAKSAYISMDATVVAVLSKLDGVSTLKDKQLTVLKAFLVDNMFLLYS